MTVSSTTNLAVYRGNGATTNFPFSFLVQHEDDLVVQQVNYLTGAVIKTYLPGEYSVTGLGSPTGGSITITPALSSAYQVTIERVVRHDQPLDIVNQGGFYPESIEAELDHKTMEIQQLASQLSRAIMAPKGEAALALPAAAGRAGLFLAFDGSGRFVPSSGTGNDSALRGDLATIGSTLIAHGNGTVADKLQESLSLKDSGATGNNDPADAAKITSWVGAVAPGRMINIPLGAYKKTGGGYELKRQASIIAEQGAIIRSDQTTGQRFNALDINITYVEGDTSSTTTGEARGIVVRGGKYATYNISTPGSDAAGGFGLAVSGDPAGDYKATKQVYIMEAQLAGGSGGFLFGGGRGSTKQLQWSGLYRCTTTGGTFAGTDGEIAVDCLSSEKPYTFDLVEGAFCSGIFRGAIATGAGAIDVVNGSKLKIHDVQIEHNTAVTSTMPLGAQILMRGNTYPGVGNEIIGCNLGAGGYITNSVALFNMRGTVIERTYFNISAGADLYLDRHSTDPTRDAYDTIVGYNLRFRGTRTRKGYGNVTDTSRLMNVNFPVAGLRKPHRGLWYPVFTLLTSTASNLTDGQMEMMIEHSGAMKFQGTLGRSSGGFTAGLTVGVFPSWVMPSQDVYLPIIVNGAMGVAFLDHTTGALQIASDHPSGNSLTICNHAWNAVTDPEYYNGPM